MIIGISAGCCVAFGIVMIGLMVLGYFLQSRNAE